MTSMFFKQALNMLDNHKLQSKFKWVEFLGPSGVGKTTIYHKAKKFRGSDDKWITGEDALEKIAKKYLSENEINLQYIARLKFFIKKISPFHISRTYDLIAGVLRNTAIEKTGYMYNDYCKILLNCHCLENELEPYKKLAFLSWFFRERLRDFMVMEYFSTGDIIVYEDGILHNNSCITDLYMDMHKTSYPNNMNYTFLPASIIYCTTDSKVILQRAIKRNQGGKGTIFQSNMNDLSLTHYIKNDIELNETKIAFFRDNNIPILTIDTSNDSRLNSNRVNQFIRELEDNKYPE